MQDSNKSLTRVTTVGITSDGGVVTVSEEYGLTQRKTLISVFISHDNLFTRLTSFLQEPNYQPITPEMIGSPMRMMATYGAIIDDQLFYPVYRKINFNSYSIPNATLAVLNLKTGIEREFLPFGQNVIYIFGVVNGQLLFRTSPTGDPNALNTADWTLAGANSQPIKIGSLADFNSLYSQLPKMSVNNGIKYGAQNASINENETTFSTGMRMENGVNKSAIIRNTNGAEDVLTIDLNYNDVFLISAQFSKINFIYRYGIRVNGVYSLQHDLRSIDWNTGVITTLRTVSINEFNDTKVFSDAKGLRLFSGLSVCKYDLPQN